jgi:signal transduction histidine kinase/CheY-like chemotaxis protein
MAPVSPWAAPSLLAAALTLALLLYVQWRRPPRPLLPSLSGALLGAWLLTAGDAASSLARDPSIHHLAIAALYTGALIFGPSAWRLAIRFAELHGEPFPWARARWTLLPVAWAAAMVPVVLTNPWHELLLTPRLGTRSSFHPLWFLNVAALHLMVMGAALLFVQLVRKARNPTVRFHARLMAAALLAPVVGGAIYLAPSSPPPFDPASLGLLVTSALFLVGIYHSRLFALEPIEFVELLQQESDGVLLLDPQGRLLLHNPAAARWLSPAEAAPRDPLYPMLARRLAAADGGALDAAALAAELGAGEQPPGGRLYRSATEPAWVRIESTPIRDRRGRLRCRSLRLRDETALRRTLEEAEQQASVLEGVLAATDEGILVHLDGRIHFVNRQFHAIWRTPTAGLAAGRAGELIGHYLPLVVDRERFLAIVGQVERDPAASVRDEVALRDGRVLERISLPLLRDGAVRGRVWRVRDVTEQRRSEETLRQAQKTESLGVLAGGIAHDFNNLLVAILGNASLARGELGPGDSPLRDYLADLERAAERASQLTRQLLDFAGRSTLQPAALDLSRLAREILELMSVSISEKIELDVELAEGLPAVWGDASQLRQVAMNLLLNAADAIGEGEGSIAVTTELAVLGPGDGDEWIGQPAWRPGRYVALRVADTGCGMSEEVRASIFDPFFTTKTRGRGLGLAASLGIVRSHDGYLRVRSKPGRGSEFKVLLPAGDEPAPPPAEGAAAAPWRSDATVLVVDDEAPVASVASRMLASAGLRVRVARDGREALALHRAERGAIDLVLLDLNMPGMAGDSVFRALRAAEPGLRILLSSGYPEREALARLADAGPVAFVPKPYTTEALLARVRAALEEG